MLSKHDAIRLAKHIANRLGKTIDEEALWLEFIRRRENSDFIQSTSSEDARYDAESDLVEEIVTEL